MAATVFTILESIIKVPFVENFFDTGTVCLVHDEELRAEFQTQFTNYDVMNYVYGVLNILSLEINIKTIDSLIIPYPVDAAYFWNKCTEGKNIRLKRPIPALECIAIEDLNWGK